MVKKKLFQSSRDGNVEEVGNLLSSGVSPNCARDIDVFWWDKTTPLNVAVGHGHTDVVKLLLDAGANPNKPDVDAENPLLHALKNGERGETERVKQMVKMLLDAGADPDEENVYGETPLEFAIYHFPQNVLELL